jgi:hypothetical protein
MAQTGYTPIQLYYSTTASAVPVNTNLSNGELAINITDGKLYYKNNSGAVTLLAGSGGGGPAAGSNTQIQFNNGGVFGASSSLTWDGTYLTAGSIKDSALTSGRVTYATTSGLLTDSANLLYSGTDLTVYGLTVGRGAGALASNTVVGASALTSGSQSGTSLVAVGESALLSNTSGANSTAVGRYSLYSNTTGSANTGVGMYALFNNTTASNNTAVGFQS